jgi:hypothetical protein
MPFTQPATDLIEARFSCRSYRDTPIAAATQRQLAERVAAAQVGPLGGAMRFELLASGEDDADALRGLGTYGFIRNPAGFLVGAVRQSPTMFEDFGYLMEVLVLAATDLGLGTCWLGGTFTHSRFCDRIRCGPGEVVPAVVSVGYISETPRLLDRLSRRTVGANHRLPWDRLFFDGQFGRPLSPEAAGPYATPLEMVRQGPSASNKQPWRLVRTGEAWHFYLQRTRRYPSVWASAFVPGDLQRMDLGIAMSHFALTAAELGLPGRWAQHDPGLEAPDVPTAYVVTWLGA